MKGRMYVLRTAVLCLGIFFFALGFSLGRVQVVAESLDPVQDVSIEAPIEAPIEASVENSIETSIETSIEDSVIEDSVVAAPIEVPAELPSEASEVPVESTIETTIETTSEAAIEATVEAPAEVVPVEATMNAEGDGQVVAEQASDQAASDQMASVGEVVTIEDEEVPLAALYSQGSDRGLVMQEDFPDKGFFLIFGIVLIVVSSVGMILLTVHRMRGVGE